MHVTPLYTDLISGDSPAEAIMQRFGQFVRLAIELGLRPGGGGGSGAAAPVDSTGIRA